MKTIYILSIEEQVKVNAGTQTHLSRQMEIFCFADSEEDATFAWIEERKKQIEGAVKESYGWYKTGHQTWCTHYKPSKRGSNYNSSNSFCGFKDESREHRRKKVCPDCKNKTLVHLNVDVASAKLRKDMLQAKKVSKVRLWRPRKSQTLGIYKWPTY